MADVAGLNPGEDNRTAMAKEMREAQRKDRKQASEGADNLKQELLSAAGAQHERPQYYAASIKWIGVLREFFAGRALRRTLRSRDNLGNPLWQMPDPIEVPLYLTLHDHELDVLESAAEQDRCERWFAICIAQIRGDCRLALLICSA